MISPVSNTTNLRSVLSVFFTYGGIQGGLNLHKHLKINDLK